MKEKKKIIILMPALSLGGAERSLIGLLSALADSDAAETDLFLYRHEGELLSRVPEKIRLLPEIREYTALARPITDVLKNGLYKQALGRLRGKKSAEKFIKSNGISGDNGIFLEYSHKYTLSSMPEINPGVEYDLAISFITPHYFASEKVRAKKRAFWVHTDYSTLAVDRESELIMWNRADYIAAVSDACAGAFVRLFPELREKTVVVENILDPEAIRRDALQTVPDEIKSRNGETVLCSVGRFCNAKNFDSVPDICRRMVETGLDVKWYLVGFGSDEELIRRKTQEAGMAERVIILGKKDNPYPYIASCDIYVQPSRYEGKAVTVREAQILCKPVVIADFTTAKSQVSDGEDGIIAPSDNGGFAERLAEVINSPELRSSLSEQCRGRDYGNFSEAEKILFSFV